MDKPLLQMAAEVGAYCRNL